MRRRELFLGLAGAAICGRLALAQQKPMPVVGYLNSQSPGPYAPFVAAFRHGLQQTGYVEGQNCLVDYRWAEGRSDELAAMASDLVRRRVAVIATGGGPAPALAAKAATNTVPIVFNVGGHPVKLGLVASLSRPGGNATGFNLVTAGLDGKRLGLLRQLMPGTQLIAVLLNPKNPNVELQRRDIGQAAQSVGQKISIVQASNQRELDAVLTKSGLAGAGALLVGADPFFNRRREWIVNAVAALGLPAIYELRDFTAAGGSMSYGPSLTEGYHLVGVYVGRILKGEKPADLPIVQPTRFELVINMKMANTLHLRIPPLLRAQADEVIE